MALATVGSDGDPSLRYVILKEVKNGNFIFYTHFTSEKGQNIEFSNKVAATFYWPSLNRSIRIKGTTSKLSKEEDGIFFDSKPLKSRIGTIVSQQSKVITQSEKNEIKLEMNTILQKCTDSDFKLEKPDNWGGYAIKPNYFEFW